jgi:hypothetical protein
VREVKEGEREESVSGEGGREREERQLISSVSAIIGKMRLR